MNGMRSLAFLLLVILSIATPQYAMADECTDNVGFRKNVPEELKQRFPLCDLFLDIEWIDPTGKFNIEYYSSDNTELKEKKLDITWRIGKLRIDDYNKTKNRMETNYLLVLVAIPKAGELPWRTASEMIEITRKDFYSKAFESFLKEATFRYSTAWSAFGKVMIEKGDKSKMLKKSFGSETHYGCLFTKSMCLLSPNEQYANFSQMRMPFKKKRKSFGGKLQERYDAILDFAHKKCLELAQKRREGFKYPDYTDVESDCLNTFNAVIDSTVVLDLNHDGKDAYFFEVDDFSQNQFVYFSHGGYYEFKEIDNDCGPNYYLNEKTYLEKCNLNVIHKGGKTNGSD